MQANHTGFKVLLVDDREENLVVLEEMLAKEGRVFLRATSGNDALKTVLKYEDIGLVMLDVQMPGMDGFEVARILKSNVKTRDISIIFVTAISKEEQYVLKGFKEGAVDYLQKPLDVNVTIAKVAVFERLYFFQQRLKNTHSEVSKVNKQLEQFVYIVAHDLKSPLAGIIGLLSIMNEEKDIVENPVMREYLDLISNAAGHLSEMITSLLEQSRKNLEHQASENFDVDEMVKQIAHLLFPPSHVKINVVDKLPSVHTRKVKLQQVFQNLMSNAIKYSDKKDGRIDIGYADEGDRYLFYVKDNGPGISLADQDKIFNLFQTSTNKSNSQSDDSTGVGLNIVKLTVEEQGGKIWADSIPGEGSCSNFTWMK